MAISNTIVQLSQSIYNLLKENRLKESFDVLKQQVHALGKAVFVDEWQELDDNYRLLLQYALNGTDDPQQADVLRHIIRRTYRLTDRVKEELSYRQSAGYDYIFMRQFLPKVVDLQKYIDNLEEQSDSQFVAEFLEQELNAQGKKRQFSQEYEKSRGELFWHIWLSPHCEAEQFTKILDSEIIDSDTKALAISALTLNVLRVFNEEHITLLLDAVQRTEAALNRRALVGIVIILSHYGDRLPYYETIRQRLSLLADRPDIVKALTNIIIQFIRTSETERISQKMQQEILPEMLKIAPQLKNKIDFDSLLNTEEGEDKNPEWESIIENSAIADKLREISELQMEGADIYMNTFAQLKYYPFFSELSNWFLPFNPSHSQIASLSTNEMPLLKLILSNAFLCNSDKYSLTLSVVQMPDKQRKTMMKAFKIESEQFEELKKEEEKLSADIVENQLSNQYIQDLYRFTKLFPSAGDFAPLFQHSLELHLQWFFEQMQIPVEQRRQIAEFYFVKEHYQPAFELFEQIVLLDNSPEIYQKQGYCQQQSGNYKMALDYYLRAEALQPEQKWLTRKIAFCYKMLNHLDEALSYYRRAETLEPNNQNMALQMGHLLVQRKEYQEALNAYFKVELANSSPKVWRAIAWCSFLSNKWEQAEKYYEKIMEHDPSKIDLMNAGHVALAMKKWEQAIDLYSNSKKMFDAEKDDFFTVFAADIDQLAEAGIDRKEIPLLLDKIRYVTA